MSGLARCPHRKRRRRSLLALYGIPRIFDRHGTVHRSRRGARRIKECRDPQHEGTALIIGLVFLSLCVALGDLLSPLLHASGVKEIVVQGLTVAGWVAMW